LFNYFDQNGNRFSVVSVIHAVCLLTKRFDRKVEFDFVLIDPVYPTCQLIGLL